MYTDLFFSVRIIAHVPKNEHCSDMRHLDSKCSTILFQGCKNQIMVLLLLS